MNVGDLFKKRMFPDFTLIAGIHGLTREISSVNVIDAPDIDKWILGGEFIIGNGFIFREDPSSLTSFLERVNEKGVAAVGIKLGRFHITLPPSAIEFAERVGLPIIEIPINYRWTDIYETFYSFMSHCGEKSVNPSSFWNENWEPSGLIEDISLSLSRKLLFHCPESNINHLVSDEKGSIYTSEELYDQVNILSLEEKNIASENAILIKQRVLENGSNVVRFCIHKDPSSIEIFLFLRKGENAPSLRQLKVVKRALVFLRAACLEKTFLFRQERKNNKFIKLICEGFLYGEEKMILANAVKNEVRIKCPCRVVIAQRIESEKALAMPLVSNYYEKGNMWIGIVECENEKTVGNLFRFVSSEQDLHVVFGTMALNLSGIPNSYQEAIQTIYWLRKFDSPKGVYDCNTTKLYTLLAKISSFGEMREIREKYWMPIVNHTSRKKKSNDCFNMENFAIELIKSDFNLKLTSKRTKMHYNTIRRYYDNLNKIIDSDLSDNFCKFEFMMSYYSSLVDKNYEKFSKEIKDPAKDCFI